MGLDEKEVNLMERTFVVTGVALAILFSLLCLAVLLWPSVVSPSAAAEPAGSAPRPPESAAPQVPASLTPAKHKFVGVEGCKACHKSDSKGNQYKHWQESKHSKAYALLASKEAKDLAAKVGVKGDPQKAPGCLKCHVTAYGVDAALIDAKFKMEDGVQCESCHGAGGDYKAIKVMKDKKAAIANGLVVPDEKTCKTCHNETAPATGERKPFNFKERFKKIAHPRPKETPAAKK